MHPGGLAGLLRAAPLPESGWSFWWRFVVATNLGWFPGIALGLQLAAATGRPDDWLGATLAGAVAAAGFGAGQAWVMRAWLAGLGGWLGGAGGWWGATLLGWTLGVLLARLLVDALLPGLDELSDTVLVGGIAGAVVGVAQAALLFARSSRFALWPIVSALGWALLVPGALPGAGLVWLARAESPSR